MGKCFSVLNGSQTAYVEEDEEEDVLDGEKKRSQHPAKMMYKTSPPWTAAKLQSKRAEFWETAPAYGGDGEVWQVLQAYHSAEDPVLAVAFLQAADITDSHELFLKACNDIGGQQASWSIFYDARGYKYEVPVFCIHDPANLIREKDEDAEAPVAASGEERSGATVENTA